MSIFKSTQMAREGSIFDTPRKKQDLQSLKNSVDAETQRDIDTEKSFLKRDDWLPMILNDYHVDEIDVLERYEGTIPGNRSDLFRYTNQGDIICTATFEDIQNDPRLNPLVKMGGNGSGDVVVVGKIMLKFGDETTPPVDDDATVWIHYLSLIEGNGDPIDSSVNRQRLSPYQLGAGQMILGMEVAVKSMHVGEIAKFLIHPTYAYGRLGCPPLIPKDSRVLFIVELVKVASKREPVRKSIYLMTSEEREKVSYEELYKFADGLREAGNHKVDLKQYFDAIDRYEKATEILVEASPPESEHCDQMKLLLKLSSNLALCYLRLDEPEQAVIACRDALSPGMPPPDNPRLNYRYAEAAFRLGNLETAEEQCDRALKISPTNPELHILRHKIVGAQKIQCKQEDILLKKMSQVVISSRSLE